MPLYEYRCRDCGVSFEELRRMVEADLPIECPSCGSTAPERKLSAFATAGGSGGASTGASSSCGPRGFS